MQKEASRKFQGQSHEPLRAGAQIENQEDRANSTRSTVSSGLHDAPGDPHSLSPAKILQLQRTIGNQAVMRLIGRAKAGSTQAPEKIIPQQASFGKGPANQAIPASSPQNPRAQGVPLIQRFILKPGVRKATVANTYQKFPAGQLKKGGLTSPMLDLARPYHTNQAKYFLFSQVIKEVKLSYIKTNKNVRVRLPNTGKRLNHFNDVISHYNKKGYDTTSLNDKFVTNNHGLAFNALLTQVPFTSHDAKNIQNVGVLYKKLTHYINKTHVPHMVRTSSYLTETIDAMVKADTSGGSGYTSSNKGSMFESWCAKNIFATTGKVTIKKRGKMQQDRQSDGYDSATQTLFDAKQYSGKMATSTNNNQYDDYRRIISKGYTGTNKEVVSKVCYIFPNAQVAGLNTHLKTKNISVAYPDKTSTGLDYV
jgi:hypothetical protein